MKHWNLSILALALSIALAGCGGGGGETSTTDTNAAIDAALNGPCSPSKTFGWVAEQSVYKNGSTTITTNAYYSHGLTCTTTCTDTNACTTSSFTYAPIGTTKAPGLCGGLSGTDLGKLAGC